MKDYYATLGVPKGASKDEIKRAFRRLAHEHHPDKGGDTEKFKEINEAYQVLSDDTKRGQYDQFGQTFEQARAGGGGPGGFGGFEGFQWPPGGFQDFDVGDIFSEFFGGGAGQRARGQDIQADVEISLEEVATGKHIELGLFKSVRCDQCRGSGGEPGSGEKRCDTCHGRGKVEHAQRMFIGVFRTVTTCRTCRGRGVVAEVKCHKCRGSGHVRADERISFDIPAGIEDGEVIGVAGKGEFDEVGGSPGDLYIRVGVRPHRIFKRKGADLLVAIDVRMTQFLVGAAINIPTLDGTTVTHTLTPDDKPGDTLRLHGKGLARRGGRGRGDLMVKLNPVMPRRVSRDARATIQRLENELY